MVNLKNESTTTQIGCAMQRDYVIERAEIVQRQKKVEK